MQFLHEKLKYLITLERVEKSQLSRIVFIMNGNNWHTDFQVNEWNCTQRALLFSDAICRLCFLIAYLTEASLLT